MYQSLTIVGNLGGDPKAQTTAKGQHVTNFSVAVNRYWKNDAGERQEELTWFRVSAWGKLGESCAKYLSKGRQVLVVGRLSVDKKGDNPGGPRVWVDSNGTPRASFEVHAAEVKFLGSAGSNGTAAEGEPPGDEIPF
jgi:single-strand DNA-binding protein